MSEIAVNGLAAITVSLALPLWGAWSADVVLASSGPISTAPLGVTLAIGKLTLKGTAIRTADFSGSRSARLVGGAGGWRTSVPARGYSLPNGIFASTILQDAARDCGESIVLDADRYLGRRWFREGTAAERQLALITGGKWWIDAAGVTRTAARASSVIRSPFTVVGWSGGRGRFEIATDVYEDWSPGRTFTAPTVSGTRTISGVLLESSNDGKARLVVLDTTAAEVAA